jgi:hypothetical protein
MSEPAINDDIRRRPSWLAPVVLVVLHSLFDIGFSPLRPPVTLWRSMLAAGALYVQPLLFAAWAAYGPGSALKRIPTTWLAYATVLTPAILVAKLLGNSTFNHSQLLAILPAVCVVATIAFLFIGRVTRWRIDNRPVVPNAGNETSQFSLRFLLGTTTICALLLGVGRGLVKSSAFPDSAMTQIPKITGYLLVLMYPANIAPLALLSAKQSVRVWIAIPFLWALLSFLGIGAYMQMERNAFNWREFRDILSIQVGAVIAALASALFLRVAGFRLVRRASKSSGLSAPSPQSPAPPP